MSSVALEISLFALGLVVFVGFIIWFGKFTGLTNLIKDLRPGGPLSQALQFAEVIVGSKFAFDMALKAGFRPPSGKATLSYLQDLADSAKKATGATKDALNASLKKASTAMAKTKQGKLKLDSAEGEKLVGESEEIADGMKEAASTAEGAAAAESAAAAEAEEAAEVLGDL